MNYGDCSLLKRESVLLLKGKVFGGDLSFPSPSPKMGNVCYRCDDTRRAFGLAWTSWQMAVNQDQTKKTLKNMGCLYCLAFFVLGKFVCLGLLFALPSVMIGMGAFYIDDCPSAPIIPIFLIVMGVYGVLETIIYGLRSCMFCERCDIVLFAWEFSKILVFGFFTWGSVGIFEIYQPNYDRGLGKYCDKTLYLFAFSVVTILWIVMVLFLLMCLLLVVILACAKEEVPDEEPGQEVDPRRGERSQ